MSEQSKSYQQGMIDGLHLWGETCGRQGVCENCPIGSIRGTNVTCQDFARQFPAKMLSILKEMNEGQITFYEEFCLRFPNTNLSVEDLATVSCRKLMFEGYVDCPYTEDSDKCLACWNEQYNGDVTEFPEDNSGLTSI